MIVEIELGDRSVALLRGLSEFLKKTHGALSDGWQPGSDLPAIGMAAFSDLLPVIKDLPEIRDEIRANPDSQALLMALLINEIRDFI